MKAGLIPHMPNEPLVMIRQCYLKICDNDACEAALLNHLEYCLTWKRRTQGQAERLNQAALASGELPTQDTEDWWYATFDELGENLLNCWGRSKVITSLNSLIERGYVERRRNPKYKMDRTWQYRLCIQNVRDGLKKAGYDIADSDDASVENNQSEDQPMNATPETVTASVKSNRSLSGNNHSSVESNRTSAESIRAIPEIPYRDSQSEITTENDSLAPVGAEKGISEKMDSALPENAWTAETIAYLASQYLAPLPLKRKEQRKQDEERWQQAIEAILSSATLVLEEKADRPHLFSTMLQYVMTEGSPSKYRANWLRDIGDIRRVKLWNIADNLFPIYQDLMKTGWRPQSEPQQEVIATAEVLPITDELPVATYPEPDRDPEPIVTPEPEMEIVTSPPRASVSRALPVGMDYDTAHAVMDFIRKAYRGYAACIKPLCTRGNCVEVSYARKRLCVIITQEDLDAFMASMEQMQLAKAS